MPLFSQRKGLKPAQKNLQLESIDQDLRNKLWSALQETVWDQYNVFPRQIESTLRACWVYYFKEPLDTLPHLHQSYGKSAYKTIREYFFGSRWNEILDLLEFVGKNIPNAWFSEYSYCINQFFEQENSAYRLVEYEIMEITDANEIESIESALSIGTKTVSLHFQRSLELLSDRKNPDYRNSIKESISAVESACQVIVGKPGATLGDCIKVIEKNHPLHPAFTQALSKLYGYTSDSGGIRHAMLEASESPTYSEAKFMLVSCSAFVNFLWAKAAELGLKLS